MILVCGIYFFQLFCCLFGSKRTLCLFPDCQLTFVVWLLCKFWRRNLEGEKTEQEKGSTGTCPPTLSLPWAVRGGLCMCPSSAVLGRSLTCSDNARSPLLPLPATQPKHEDECKFRLGTSGNPPADCSCMVHNFEISRVRNGTVIWFSCWPGPGSECLHILWLWDGCFQAAPLQAVHEWMLRQAQDACF